MLIKCIYIHCEYQNQRKIKNGNIEDKNIDLRVEIYNMSYILLCKFISLKKYT